MKIARLGRHSSLHTTPDDEEGVRVKKNGWRIYDQRTRNGGSSSYVLESIYLVLHAERDGYKRYKVMFCPHATVYHLWERESKRNYKLLMIHIQSILKYFLKWGLKF